MKMIRLTLGLAAILVATHVRADFVPYGEVVNLRAVERGLAVTHHHDWGQDTWDARQHATVTHQDPFRADNTYAWIRLESAADGEEIAKLPSPALTWIGFANSGRYIVGLSDIKVHNAYQLVVWTRKGDLAGRRRITGEVACLDPSRYAQLLETYPDEFLWLEEGVDELTEKVYVDFMRMTAPDRLGQLWDLLIEHRCRSPFLGRFGETVTNHVYWFDEEHPAPEVEVVDGKALAVWVADADGLRIRLPLSRAVTSELSSPGRAEPRQRTPR